MISARSLRGTQAQSMPLMDNESIGTAGEVSEQDPTLVSRLDRSVLNTFHPLVFRQDNRFETSQSGNLCCENPTMPTPYDCEARVNCNGFFLSVVDQVGCHFLDIIRFRIIHSFLDLFCELVVFDFV